jgi:autotransporter-associated beta strand protein
VKQYQFNRAAAISTALISLFTRTRSNRFVKRGELLSCAIAGLLLAATASGAIDVTWTGSANNNWSNGGNWNVGEPFAGDRIIFPNTGQTNVRADFSSYPETDPRAFAQPPLHLEAATFAPAAPAYTIELYVATEPSFYQANLTYDGAGVTNSSGVMQNFVIDRGSMHAEANGQYTGLDGSQLIFNNSASAGTSVTYHAQAGATAIVTQLGITTFLRPSGGSVLFNNNASAGSATLIADGGAGNGGLPAFVEFHNNSTASTGYFISDGGALGANIPGQSPASACGFGGETIFFDTSNAGTAHFTMNGTPGAGGSGGLTKFTQHSSAANGVFVTNPAATSHVGSGIVQFLDNSTAANGNFTNISGPESVSNGFTQFWDNSNAANAVIENLSGADTFGGTTIFHDHATAGTDTTTPAVINNHGLSGGSGLPGTTSFYDDSTAGTVIIHNLPGPYIGGATEFHGNSTAANAHIFLEPGNVGGTITFFDNSTAAAAHLDAGANGANGTIEFKNQSNAGSAVIDLDDHGGGSLSLRFRDTANAQDATITAGIFTNVQFFNDTNAGNAIVTMRADSTLTFGGNVEGPPTTTANHAYIHLEGGGTVDSSGAVAQFLNSATAANATIIVDGATTNGATGARLVFNNADAGTAAILLKSAVVADNPGGSLLFAGGASAPQARVTIENGSLISVGSNAFFGNGGTSIGSIEGAGAVSLGSSTLIVGALGLNTTFSGIILGNIQGPGVPAGSLTKTGSGTFTLTGTNTYTGLTTVEEGTLSVNGSIAGDVDVKNGATLKGIGSIGGMVTCETGCMLGPGNSPGTITVGGLDFLTGSTLQFELGATRDHIVVTNSGTVTISGRLDLSVLPAFNPALGDSFALFEGSIGSITGTFSAVNAPIFSGHALNLVYGTNQVMLVVGAAGDFNGDGTVNAADYVVWRKRLGTQDEYNAWRTHFGQSSAGGNGTGATANATVPEPAILTLLLFPSAAFSAINRRRRVVAKNRC